MYEAEFELELELENLMATLAQSDLESEAERFAPIDFLREQAIIAGLAARGVRNENQIADAVFFNRHRERNGKIIGPNESALRQEWVQIRDQLVRPMLGCPKSGQQGGPVLLDHIYTPKVPDPVRPGTFIVQPLGCLAPAGMNPLYFKTDTSVIADTSPTGLQHCLDILISTNFAGLLGSTGQTGPGSGDRVHVALIDLTGNKLTAPDFAGWGAPVDMYGASVPKILALYAAFQLRPDLHDLIDRRSLSNGTQLESAAITEWKTRGLTKGFPDLVWLFDVRKWTAGATLGFTAQAQSTFQNIMHNCPAGTLIAKVGLPYIASVAWQSGLYHPSRSGLWLKSGYCGLGSWTSPVNTPFSHNATALSAATYFTLLAQGRLVDDASSAEISNALKVGCVTSLFPTLPVVASKCGIYDGYLHDCAWIQDGSVRYIIAILSRLRTQAEQQLYTQLCSALDTLIRRNNQSPKQPCTA
jgi:hypothetical protein